MTPRLLPTLACLVLLAGCGSTPPPRAAAVPQPFASPESESGYHVLMGELAEERGDQAIAASEYLQASKLSSDASLAAHAALLAYGAPDTAAALAAAEHWQALAPQSADAGHFVAVLRARLGDTDGAANQFQALLKAGLDKSYATAAELLEDETDAPHAMPVMQRLVDDAPQSADAHYAYAHAAMHYRHYNDAVDESRRAYALDPTSDSILVLLARALADSGRRDEALVLLEPRVRAAAGDLGLRLAYAALLADASRYVAARDELEAVLKTHPGNADVIYTLGLLALQDKDLAAAEDYFTRLLKTGRRNDDAIYYLGSVAENRQHYPQALDWYHKVGDGDRWFPAQTAIGRTLVESGSTDAALDFFDGLADGDPDSAVSTRLAEGQVFSDLGQSAIALKVYDQALKLRPDDDDLLYARALLFEQGGSTEAAEDDLRSILTRQPDDAEALNALGYTLTLHSTRYTEAHDYIARALKLEPDDAAIMDSMGWVEYRLGDKPAALAYLKKAYAELADPEIAAHLVEVMWESGDQEGARTLWTAALKANPGSEALKGLEPRFKP